MVWGQEGQFLNVFVGPFQAPEDHLQFGFRHHDIQFDQAKRGGGWPVCRIELEKIQEGQLVPQRQIFVEGRHEFQ